MILEKEGRNLWVYDFKGYWKDVGTIQAYWESNMELVKRVPEFNLYDQAWKIYTPNPVMAPHYVGRGGSVQTSVVAEGCMIYGSIRRSVIFPGVIIKGGAMVEDSIIMANSRIGSDAYISHSIIGENVCVSNNVKIGIGEVAVNEYKPAIYNSGITVIGDDADIPNSVTMGKNVMVDIGVNYKDFYCPRIPSGRNIFKGGVYE